MQRNMKTQPISSKARYQRDRPGFALIVVTLLMVLLVLLGLGMLTISAVELRQGQFGEANARAKANARIGLMLALAELQTQLGPDQRISAPGGQLLPGGAATSPGALWTGVYDSWKYTGESDDMDPSSRPDPSFRRWLISGADFIVKDRNSAVNGRIASQPAERVTLVAEVSAPGNPTPPVEAGLVPIAGGSTAWWVSDQSMKAKLGDPATPPFDSIQAANRMQSSPRVDHKTFTPGLTSEDDPGIVKLVTTDSARLLDPNSGTLIHDATVYSKGVFANVRKGGLRNDLSFLLERPWSEVKSDPRMGALYESGGKGGINLRELWAYYNIWGELKTNPPPHPDGSTFPSGVKYLEHPPGANAARSDPFFAYKSLTPLEARFALSFVSVKDSNDPTGTSYHLYIVLDPIFTVWNPFNVTYSIPTAGFNNLVFFGLLYAIEITATNPATGLQSTYTRNLRDDNLLTKRWINFLVARDSPLVMKPGEVQILGEPPGATLQLNGKPKNRVRGALGYSYGTGIPYVIKYPPPIQNTGSGSPKKIDQGPIVFKADDVLKIEFVPTNERSGVSGKGNNSLGHLRMGVGDTTGSPGANAMIGAKWSLNELELPYINTELQASVVPQVLPPVRSFNTKRVGDIEFVPSQGNASGSKWTLAIMSLGIATETDREFRASMATGKRIPGMPFMNFNPKMQAMDLDQLTDEMHRLLPLQVGMRRYTPGSVIEQDASGLGFYGNDRHSNTGVSHIVTHALPFRPIHSIAAFQNSIANGLDKLEIGPFSGGDPVDKDEFLRPGISHAIGNSFAPGILGKAEVKGTVGPYPVADHSYLANLKLWDDYFFSSISPTSTSAQQNETASRNEQKIAFEAFLEKDPAKNKPLPNEKIVAFLDGGSDPVAALFPTTTAASGKPSEKSAEFLMIDGAFNVNSTSVPAWTALLKGLKNAQVPTADATSPQAVPTLTPAVGVPFPGLLTPAGVQIDESSLSAPNTLGQWTGFRALDDTKVSALAEAIVNQVKLRGPFLSLADFINRRPGSDADLAVAGPLQAALDDPSVDVNGPLSTGSGRETPASERAGYAFPDSQKGPRSRGIPGFLKQGDILTALGPLLSVRGDTFLVRAYGDSRDASGKVLARAWCEATVQRLPTYVDDTDEPYVATDSLTSQQNMTFGRRFRIVTFRFLSPKELETSL